MQFGPVKDNSAKLATQKNYTVIDSAKVPILEESEGLSIENIVSLLPAKQFSSSRSVAAANNAADEILNKNDFSSDGIFTVIRDPRIFEKLEENGFYLGSHFGLSNGSLNNEELFKKSSLYQSLSEVLTQDLKDIILMEKKAGLSVGPSMKNTGRIFNYLWFKAAIAHYELVGITNRLDRVFFNQNTCGEMRFIYRLSYEKPIDQEAKQLYSRLPLIS